MGSESGFQPIPTRIADLPPLVVDRAGDATAEEVQNRLQNLALHLAQIHRTAAEAHLSQGNYDAALPHAEAAATFAPTNIEYHNQLGFLRYVSGNDAGAIASFETVLAAQPGHPDALFNLGMVHFGQGNHIQAEECFRRSLEGQPDNAETWNNRGVCLHHMQRTADAQACFQRALQSDPQHADAQANLQSLQSLPR